MSAYEFVDRSSRYGRHCKMWLEVHECDVCHKPQTCLSVDTSDEEYGPGFICLACINAAFEHMPAKPEQVREEW